jgi:High-affinity K+ transport system, ATPase chain B
VVAEKGEQGARVLGVIELKDVVKGGIKERFAELRKMGIKTIMVTGDNRLTAARLQPKQASTISSPKPRRKRSSPRSAHTRPKAVWWR